MPGAPSRRSLEATVITTAWTTASAPRSGVPAEEKPRQFVPDGTYPPNDLSWYANIPVPTSYMITRHRA